MWRLGLSSELSWPSPKQEWAELRWLLAAGGRGNSLLHPASWHVSSVTVRTVRTFQSPWWFLWQMWRLLHNVAIKPDPTLRPYFLCPDSSVFNLYLHPASVGVFGVTAPTLHQAAPCTARHISKYTQSSSPMETSLFIDKKISWEGTKTQFSPSEIGMLVHKMSSLQFK